MKKLFYTLALAITLLLLLSACGRTDEQEQEEITTPPEIILAEPDIRWMFRYDLNYLQRVLEENFALLDVIRRDRGIDLLANIDAVRAEVEANPEMDLDGFYSAMRLLNRGTPHFHSFGGFSIMSPGLHMNTVTNYPGSALWQITSDEAFDRIQQPHVMDFYMPRWPEEGAVHDRVAAIEATFELPNQEEVLAERIRLLEYTRMEEFIGMYTEAFLARDAEMVDEIETAIGSALQEMRGLHTEIISEGEIAYMFITMAGQITSSELLEFYTSIRDFDHLIVDMRAYSPWSPRMLSWLLISPNITEHFQMDNFAFFMDGYYSSQYSHLSSLMVGMHNLTDIYRVGHLDNPEAIIGLFNIPENFNMDDIERMDYGIRTRMDVHPNTQWQILFDGGPLFNGKIWVLIGTHTTTGGEIAARAIQQAGIATLVGGITGGMYGGPRTMFALPYTGIAFQMDVFYTTDGTGRPFESGTVPDIFNRPGMNAFETVLAVIAEESELD